MRAYFLVWAAVIVFGDAASSEPERGLLVATNPQEATTARLVEADEAVIFEITGPANISPSVAIDVRRNGKIDADDDFEVSLQTDGTPCLSRLLEERKSSQCGPLGDKATVMRKPSGDSIKTTFTFPKRLISGDGFGFGFAISLWNENGRYGAGLGGGDYRFGGFLQLVKNGPNFLGERATVPSPIMPAVHQYEGCLNHGTIALQPLDSSKLTKLKAVPGSCKPVREAALDESVKAAIASGSQKPEAEREMRGLLDQIDASFARLVHLLEAGPSKN